MRRLMLEALMATFLFNGSLGSVGVALCGHPPDLCRQTTRAGTEARPSSNERLAAADPTQGFEFQAEHQHTLRNCRGTLTITPEKIEYKTAHKDDSRTWRYGDIRQIKVESPKAIEMVTYEDQKRMLGRDRIFKFRLLSGEITPEISALLMTKATRPVVTSVVPPATDSPTFEMPVKHLHTWGGCEGTLKIYPDRVSYESATAPRDSRFWRYADIERFGQPSRYRFELTTFEDKFGGPQKVYNFQLKTELPAEAYDFLWVRLHPTNYYFNVQTKKGENRP